MKLRELAAELHISSESIKRFIQDFDLDLNDTITTNFDVKDDFEKFARENADFLRKYEEDLNREKSAEGIAKSINKPVEKVEEEMKKTLPNLYDNGPYKSSVSTYGIDRNLGGDYRFVYDYFGNKSPLAQRDFIGYRDLFFYISDVLEAFINPDAAKNWGIRKAAGIVLYGPPGSGKIFWAKKIAEIISYHFEEIKKHYFGVEFTDGGRTGFNDFMAKKMQQTRALLFMEDFDGIMAGKNAQTAMDTEDEETKEIILHYISKFPESSLLMAGAAVSLKNLDDEILAPGRFDVLIPIFPPNLSERAEMILYHLTDGLEKDSLLFKILENNHAASIPFWLPVAEKMKIFSNTMIVDFTQSLKKRIRNLYQKTRDEHLKIDGNLTEGARRDAAAKLTDEYLSQTAGFLQDARKYNYDDFRERISAAQQELDAYKVADKPVRAIGFTHNSGADF